MKKLQIQTPCSKKWEDMQGKSAIRHCESCNRNVEDFINKSIEEIVEILENRKERTCARIFSSQLNPVKKMAAVVLIGGMLMGGSCSPKTSKITLDSIEYDTRKNDVGEGYIEMESDSVISVKSDDKGNIPVSFEGVIYNEEGKLLEDCIISVGNFGTLSKENGEFAVQGTVKENIYKSTIVRIYRRASHKQISIPLEVLNHKKGLKIYLKEIEIKPNTPIIIGKITIESPIRNS